MGAEDVNSRVSISPPRSRLGGAEQYEALVPHARIDEHGGEVGSETARKELAQPHVLGNDTGLFGGVDGDGEGDVDDGDDHGENGDGDENFEQGKPARMNMARRFPSGAGQAAHHLACTFEHKLLLGV